MFLSHFVKPLDAKGRLSLPAPFRAALAKEVARLQSERKATRDRGIDLENERAEIAILAEMARKLGAEAEAVRVELEAPGRITILAPARVPRTSR